MSYVTENNETYRNMQEQVLKNAEDIAVLKTGIVIFASCPTIGSASPFITEANLGKYILIGTTTPKNLYVVTLDSIQELSLELVGPFPAGIKGDTGETGATGPQGTRGPALWSVGSTKPSPASPYINDDLILMTAGECKGQVYKLSNGKWLPVTSVIGPEGPIGPSVDIVVNPDVTGQTVQQMNYLKVNGIYYNTTHLTTEEQAMLTNLLTNAEWNEDGSITFGHDVTADGNVVAHNDVEVGRNLYVDDSTKIQDPDGNQIFGHISENVVPISNHIYTLGLSNYIWSAIYGDIFYLKNNTYTNKIQTNIYGGLELYKGNDVALVIGGSDVRYYNKHMLPASGNTSYSIGSDSAKWKDGYYSGTCFSHQATYTNSSNYTWKFEANDNTSNFYIINSYNSIVAKIPYNGYFEFQTQIKIGNTTLTEAQLIALLNLL